MRPEKEAGEARRVVHLKVGGHAYRVATTANEADLTRLVGVVEAKLAEVSPQGPPPPQALLLAAIALAHDVEAERARRDSVERRARDLMRRALMRIEGTLEHEAAH